MSQETHAFRTEVQKLLDLMIHSLYTNKDVFLRELVSNASDALDRRRFSGLTDAALQAEGELEIRLRADAEARTLEISDNGIGMTRDEVVDNLGTIARSGTLEYLKQVETEGRDDGPDLIGQFGVGFYASFMVAEEVEVVTRRAGTDEATRWVSSGDGSFTLDSAERPEPGTTILLKLKPVDGENGIANYTDQWVLRQIVRKYSDFVAYPIRLDLAGVEGDDAPGDEPLNSMRAIWTRPADQVTEEEYEEFYRHISHDFNDPLLHFGTKIEGTFEASALLYLPARAPFDLYHREMAHRGIQLYVRRVFIMDECRDLMPEFLRFVRGVVDAEDLSLNVSREMLQQDRQIQSIRKHLVKKVLDALKDLQQDDNEGYLAFWAQFGPVLKEGLLDAREKRERILDLMLCHSTREAGTLTSLADYADRMGEDQESIYYLVGTSLDAISKSPHLEAFAARGIEVLLFTDPVDEIWLHQMPPTFREKKWQSVGHGEIELGPEDQKGKAAEERKEIDAAYEVLVDRLRIALQEQVKEVRLSHRLTESPACLVADEGDLSPQIEAMLRQAGQQVPERKPILEINPTHPLLEKLQSLLSDDGAGSETLDEYAELLFGQAVLAEGGRLPDPAAFSRKLADLMLRAI